MKVKYEIDVEEVINELNSVSKAELAKKLAWECLDGKELVDIAKDELSPDEILDCIDDYVIVKYLENRGYKVED